MSPKKEFVPLSVVVAIKSLSHVWLFMTPWTAVSQVPLSFTISLSLLRFMSIESVMPSNHLVLYHPLLLLPSVFPSIKVFAKELALPIQLPKYWSFSISPPSEYSGWISFRIYWLLSHCCTMDSQESSLTPQFENINSLVLSFLCDSTLIGTWLLEKL